MLTFILIVLVMAVSLSFCFVVQLRLACYARKNPLPESKYTKLFKFVKLSYVNLLYIIAVLVHAVLFIMVTYRYLL